MFECHPDRHLTSVQKLSPTVKQGRINCSLRFALKLRVLKMGANLGVKCLSAKTQHYISLVVSLLRTIQHACIHKLSNLHTKC